MSVADQHRYRSVKLRERALRRRLVRTPTPEFRPMAKSIAGHVIELHFHHEFRPQRLPFATALGTPTAGTSGRLAGKAGPAPECLQPPGQRRPLAVCDR